MMLLDSIMHRMERTVERELMSLGRGGMDPSSSTIDLASGGQPVDGSAKSQCGGYSQYC